MTTFTTTECKLCHKHFEIPADLAVAPLPDPVNERVKKLVYHLWRHLEKAHSEVAESLKATNEDVQGLNMLKVFEHEDESLLRRMNQIRILVHRAVGITIDDATLQDRIARLALSTEDAQTVLVFCRELRSVLTEIPLQP